MALADMAIWIGRDIECGYLRTLDLEQPLVVPRKDPVRVELIVDKPDANGERKLEVFSRLEDSAHQTPWARHAHGFLIPHGPPTADESSPTWPPAGADPLDIAQLYGRLSDAGYHCPPDQQCISAAWRHDNEAFAELRLPDGVPADGFGVHPALLDASLQLLAADEGMRLPVSLFGATVHSSGSAALRVRVTQSAHDVVSLIVTDEDDAPVMTLSNVRLEPADRVALAARQHRDPLFCVEWMPGPPPTSPQSRHCAAVGQAIGLDAPAYPDLAGLTAALDAGATRPDAVFTAFGREPAAGTRNPATDARDAALRALTFFQEWLADNRLAETQLVVVTRGATPVPDDAAVRDLAQATIRGLAQTVQAEYPDRFLLVDLGEEDDPRTLLSAVDAGEPQVAVRDGVIYRPRMKRAQADNATLPADKDGTVLIADDSGEFGPLIARHLAAEHGVSNLLLAGRNEAVAGLAEIRKELADLGADLTVAVCDTADRHAVGTLLGSARQPVSAIIHASGTADDGIFASVTPQRFSDVVGQTIESAYNLHELSAGLSAFILFSSAAATIGSAGHACSSAAGAFLDALAGHRRAGGMPATSLAFGPWSTRPGRAADGRPSPGTETGLRPLSVAEGLALFDAAWAARPAQLFPVRLAGDELRRQARNGDLNTVFQGLIRPGSGHVRAASGTFVRRISDLPQPEQQQALLDLVCSQATELLGHHPADSVHPERAFKEIGFDSMTAVELRNRLNAATGLRLPATLVFDHPNPASVAQHLHKRLFTGDTDQQIQTGLKQLEKAISAADLDDAEGSQIAARLQELLSKLRKDKNEADRSTTERINSATADEILDFIDNEIGRPFD
jgi:acyl carrier protein